MILILKGELRKTPSYFHSPSKRAVLLPPELLRHVEEFIEANKQLGYTTREEFIREALTETLQKLPDKCEYARVPKREIREPL